MKFILLLLLFAASCLCAETDTNLYDRVFFVRPSKRLSIEQTCTIIPGETILLGGGSAFDQEWVYYAFLPLDILPAKKIILE